ncbi:hypothetical protein PGIGA_G00042540 [Pangasianodon gigas]|uniref:Uncharacterized protein n=1 Tax=Pangasianodon gigas TaxID=30993 RepID=A0ACC5X089_PANGG|nr:hypothetical protein [Pangasianodon gigas]
MQSPTLTRISPDSVVSPGEVLQFRCTTPSPTCISVDFTLYKTGISIKKQTAESTTTFTLTVDASHQGQYTCDYSYRESNSTSSRSNSINITVVNLQQPNISFSAADGWSQFGPDGAEVIRGYGFSIVCSIEPQYPGGSFHLEFSGSNITKTQSAVNHSATFLFSEADFVNQGNYNCSYEVNVSSRTFTSTTTEPLTITVKVNLQQPNISFSAADGWSQFGPDGAEVIRGYGFSIVCSIEPQYPGGSFHLEFSGSNITKTQSAVNHSATFLFSEADFVNQGNYNCSYEVNVSSRTFTSTTTEPLTITVKVSLDPFIGFGLTAGLLLILLPVIIWVVKTQKRQKFQVDRKDTQCECAENTSESLQEENKTHAKPYCEIAETIFHQKEIGQ